jgi:hypothetical protein
MATNYPFYFLSPSGTPLSWSIQLFRFDNLYICRCKRSVHFNVIIFFQNYLKIVNYLFVTFNIRIKSKLFFLISKNTHPNSLTHRHKHTHTHEHYTHMKHTHNCPDNLLLHSTVETLLKIACFLILLKAENIYFSFIFITNHPHNNFDLAFGHFISH